MSEYVIPADADREMLKQMISEVETKLVAQRSLIDKAADAELPGLERTERRLAEFLQRLETRVSSTTCECMEGTVAKNRADIDNLKQTSVEQGAVLTGVVDRVSFLEAFCMQLRDQVDRVDNTQHRQNALVYGFELGEPWSAAQSLFKNKQEFVPEVDDVFFLQGQDPETKKKCPLKLQFKSLTAARNFLAWSDTDEFKYHFPYIGAGRDQTTLRRVGISRLSAAAQALRVTFNGAHIPPAASFLKYKGRKYDAIEFAAAAILIDGMHFNIEQACKSSADCEVNKSLSVQQGTIETRGYKSKNGRGRGRGRGGGNGNGGGGGGSQRGGGGGSQRGGGGGSQPPRGKNRGNYSNVAPRYQGTTTGGVTVSAGSDKRHGNTERLDMAGGIDDRYVRV
jgi:uncharacterized membrane protein YgcG